MSAPHAGRAAAAPLPRAAYRHWRRDVIRFADLDTLGHVNNVAYATFLETGRVGFFVDLGVPVDGAERLWMAVRLEIDYRRQLSLPGAVDIGSGVLDIGRTSVRLAHGIFAGDACAASGECVMVMVERATGRPRPIPDDVRARLEALRCA